MAANRITSLETGVRAHRVPLNLPTRSRAAARVNSLGADVRSQAVRLDLTTGGTAVNRDSLEVGVPAHAYTLEVDGSPLSEWRSRARAKHIAENYGKHLEGPRRRGGSATLFYAADPRGSDPWTYYPVLPNRSTQGADYIEIGRQLNSLKMKSFPDAGAKYLADEAVALDRWLKDKHRPVNIVYPARDTLDYREGRAEIHFMRWPPRPLARHNLQPRAPLRVDASSFRFQLVVTLVRKAHNSREPKPSLSQSFTLNFRVMMQDDLQYKKYPIPYHLTWLVIQVGHTKCSLPS